MQVTGWQLDDDPIICQFRPHRLEHEVDECTWRVQIELSVGVAADESFHVMYLGPCGQVFQISPWCFTQERDLRSELVSIAVRRLTAAELQVHVGAGLAEPD